jgi:protein TonB
VAASPASAVAVTAPVMPAAPVVATEPAVSLGRLRESYKAALLAAIERHKFYPARARRRGLEGQVLVRFRINADGQVEAISLAESCGSGLLDRAALRTIERLGKLAPLPPALGLSHWDLMVPIEYRLL